MIRDFFTRREWIGIGAFVTLAALYAVSGLMQGVGASNAVGASVGLMFSGVLTYVLLRSIVRSIRGIVAMISGGIGN